MQLNLNAEHISGKRNKCLHISFQFERLCTYKFVCNCQPALVASDYVHLQNVSKILFNTGNTIWKAMFILLNVDSNFVEIHSLFSWKLAAGFFYKIWRRQSPVSPHCRKFQCYFRFVTSPESNVLIQESNNSNNNNNNNNNNNIHVIIKDTELHRCRQTERLKDSFVRCCCLSFLLFPIILTVQ